MKNARSAAYVIARSKGGKQLHKQRPAKKKPKKQIVKVLPGADTIDGRSVTLQLERVKCGRATCRKWHGPYWYAYWTIQTRTRTLYIGRERRPVAEVRAERDERKAARAQKDRELHARDPKAWRAKVDREYRARMNRSGPKAKPKRKR